MYANFTLPKTMEKLADFTFWNQHTLSDFTDKIQLIRNTVMTI